MKTNPHFRLKQFLFATALLSCTAAATNAQDSAYADTKPSADKGYWQLKTDAIAQNTTIDFYGRDHQLVYQETIPGQYVKLNKRNRRLLDETTEQLTDNRLLASAIKTTPLITSPTNSVSSDKASSTAPAASQFETLSYINANGVLRVAWNNPGQEKTSLSILDDQKRVIHQEHSFTDKFRARYNLSQLESGRTYTLMVVNNRTPYTYRISMNTQQITNYKVQETTPGKLTSKLGSGSN